MAEASNLKTEAKGPWAAEAEAEGASVMRAEAAEAPPVAFEAGPRKTFS